MDDQDANTPAAPRLGEGGRYAIRRVLGRGMMGVVYEAEDSLLGRVVALKTIELALGVPEELRRQFEQRFFTEARIAAKLSHPGIVVCHDFGKDPASGKLFIVFERLKGRTLAERVAAGGLEWRDAVAIVVRVARAIQHAHEHGVVHRDLKPANIMLLETNAPRAGEATDVKIMDFGVAKLESVDARLTATGQWFGSPAYVSPEQALGQRSDARSDIFSLGSVLCTLLLGRPWFDAPSIPETLRRVIHGDAPVVSRERPGLPAALDRVAGRALARHPEGRYGSASEMADELEDVLAGRMPGRVSGAGLVSDPPPRGGDALLADLVAPTAASAVGVDPADALASLVDLPPGPVPGPRARTSPAGTDPAGTDPVPPSPLTTVAAAVAPATATVPPGPTPAVPGRRLRTALVVAAVVTTAAILAAAVWLLRRETAAGPAAAYPPPNATPGPASAVVETVAQAESPEPMLTPQTTPTMPTLKAEPTPMGVTPSPAISPKATATATPTSRGAGALEPASEAAAEPATAVAPDPVAAPASPVSPTAARLRLDVEHPLENGRLIAWIDGVLVFEAKLQAPVAKKIVAIKLREGRVEKMLDVAPGRHEVKVEVSWEGEHRAGTQVVDVASGATGLLEVRLSRLTKELSLEWSRLADR